MIDPWQQKMPQSQEDHFKKLVLVVYALQAASLLTSGMTLFAGVIINYVRRDDVRGSWLESHFRWQIRTFWFWLLWTCVGAVTAVFLIGWAILTAAMLWLIYRVVKGWLYLGEQRALPS